MPNPTSNADRQKIRKYIDDQKKALKGISPDQPWTDFDKLRALAAFRAVSIMVEELLEGTDASAAATLDEPLDLSDLGLDFFKIKKG